VEWWKKMVALPVVDSRKLFTHDSIADILPFVVRRCKYPNFTRDFALAARLALAVSNVLNHLIKSSFAVRYSLRLSMSTVTMFLRFGGKSFAT
jgi:hypothetical protein